MAVTKQSTIIQSVRPRWPNVAELREGQVRFTYDRPTDTLFVDFFGGSPAAASIPLDRGDRDYLYLRIDPQTDAVVGLQIEHFLSYAIARHPELLGALEVAGLVGIDREALHGMIGISSAGARADDPVALIEDVLRLSA